MCCWGEADHSRHPHSICCLPSFTGASRHLPPIHGICLKFISSLDALVLPLCGLNFLHTPPTYCNFFLACLCFFTFYHSLNCHAPKINATHSHAQLKILFKILDVQRSNLIIMEIQQIPIVKISNMSTPSLQVPKLLLCHLEMIQDLLFI